MGAYGVILVVAAGTTCLLIPLMRWVAERIGAVVEPDDRRVHARATATLGGAAMIIGLLVSLVVASFVPSFGAIFDHPAVIWGIAVAAVVIYGVGQLDDLREVSPPAKLAGMVLAGTILTFVGVTIIYFRVPFLGFTVLSPDLSALVSVLWVVGMANAINLIDGLDGLAAGIVVIAGGSFFLYSTQLDGAGALDPSNPGPLIAVIAVGVCLGFLPFNFHPARIFMGDAGALLLGLLMAASTMAVGGQTDDPFSGNSWFFFAPLILPLIILGIPVLDVALSIVRRATRRSGVATADKDHLHHRLMRLGHGQRRAVLILWAWTALLSTFVLIPVYTSRGNGIVPVGIAGLGLFLFTVLHPEVRRTRAGNGNGDGGGSQPEGELGIEKQPSGSLER